MRFRSGAASLRVPALALYRHLHIRFGFPEAALREGKLVNVVTLNPRYGGLQR